ncbi:hypothetical protein MIMGU_mgv1a024756mg [Erythranthe guttata]|uniref:Uncharacterized protein n=1 Tax=Erythranthe guttata TaxID=4155 RepID=A0A022QLS4_ERYGU|nr:PREDICTED: putative E3 ubiquitin-protein ligase RF298 [Erythranthe guttata]EYU28544.1 hypothetical protein MIMGU_mgv1a024756mg [Erythranthe guttata]|eukprot:XP_012847912.1 PREDICTED: putative E3 ubiquitin-protein ligase RF298 [Erythranthe guttata]
MKRNDSFPDGRTTYDRLVAHKEALEKEFKGWSDWANEKVMLAEIMVEKSQSELKLLKQEKEELDKFDKESRTLEEVTTKRLSEMQIASENTVRKIKLDSLTLRRLEEENMELKEMMEDARLKALASANNVCEARRREQETLKKLQSCERELTLLVEELACHNRKNAELEEDLGKVNERRNQLKVLIEHEKKEKLKVSAQLDFLRAKRKEFNDLMKMQDDTITQTAEKNKQTLKAKTEDLEK